MTQGRFFPKWREKWRSSEYRLPRREEVIVIAILDSFAVLATVVAASVLALHAESARTWWWWGVAVASLLVVYTSVLLSQLWVRRRSFIDESLRLADHLDELRKPEGPTRSL
jgi:membrane protein YdbS with pleckstrin-like domain